METERAPRELAQASTEIARILDELTRAFDGETWHGDPLMTILESVDAAIASSRPIPTAHTIWEIVLHLTLWHNVVARRLEGESFYPSASEDWPSVSDASPQAWRRALVSLAESHATLLRAVERLDDRRLADIAPGRQTNLYVHLHGVAQHDAYHGGQIVLLKKAQAA